METSLLVLAVLAIGWFAVLMRRPRRDLHPDADGPGVDPALTRALDATAADQARMRGYP
ncbi:hypothetical protein [Microbacterium sp. 3J1]|uniref:hypothetical protein n=1 Tax=Microbacterium sp. 3J1 TaxID=861269 RepID=UPI00159EF205|nr:hypothetical protein [Microbacterium sp. 3J1]